METSSQNWYKLHIISFHLLFSSTACWSTELLNCQTGIFTVALNSFSRFLSQIFCSWTFLFLHLSYFYYVVLVMTKHYLSQCITAPSTESRPTTNTVKPANFHIMLISGCNVSMHIYMHYFHTSVYRIATSYQRTYLSQDPTLN